MRWSRALAVLALAFLAAACSKEQRAARTSAAAENYFQTGDYDRAEIAYKNVLRDNPRDALATGRLGVIWLDRGDPLQSSAWLAKAKKLEPGNLAVRVQLAKAMFAMGAAQEAREELRQVLKVSPANGQAVLAFAETSESAVELAEAKAHLEKFSSEESAPFLVASSLVALRQGEARAGERDARRACELDPRFATARALRAALHLSANDLAAAEDDFRAAADLSPIRSPERLKLAAFLLQTGRKPEALALLSDLTAKAADFLPAWRMQAQIALAEHRHEDAAKLLERVFARAPADLEAGLMQTEILLTKGEGDKAVALMKQLQTAFPDRPGIEFHLARAYLSVANQTLANESLDHALQLDPGYSDAVLLRARLKLSQGETEEVAKAMVEYLDQHPDDVQGQLLLVDAYRGAGRLDAAEAVLKRSTESAAGDFRPHLFMGMILRSKGDPAGARAAFEEAQQLAPDNLLVTLQLAALDVLEKDLPGAKQRVDQQLSRNPSSAGAHYLSAAVADERRDWKEAEQALLRAINLETDFLAAYGLLIRVYVEAGKTEEAAEQLRHFIAENPDNVAALMQLGTIYQETGRPKEARDCYERITRLDSSFAPALNNLAILHAEVLGEPEKAYEIATQARTLLPQEGAVADTLGWIVLQRKDYKRAFALLQEAAQSLPDHPGVQYHLGVAAVRSGDAVLAKSALERALATGRDFKGKAEAGRALENLRSMETAGLKEIEAMVAADPQNVVSLLAVGHCLEKEGRHQDAAKAYLNALEINPDAGDANLRLASLYGGPLKDRERALEFGKRARQASPHDPRVAASLGGIAFHSGNHAWAYSLLQEAAAGLPGDPAVAFSLGRAAYATGRVDEARAAIARVGKDFPDAPEAREAAGFLSLLDLDPFSQEGSGRVEAVLQESPHEVPALMAKAGNLETSDRKGEAEGLYREILRIYPDFAPAAKRLAILCADDPDKVAEAASFAAKAREILTEDSELSATLARIKFLQEDFGLACQLLQDAEGRRTLEAGELYMLGMSLGQLKRKPEARQVLQRALEAGLQESEATKARSVLRQLQ